MCVCVCRRFDYALRRKGVEKMIVCVMESSCRNPNSWAGGVGAKMGGLLYVDMSNDERLLGSGLEHLIEELKRMTHDESTSAMAPASAPASAHPSRFGPP